MVRFLSMLTGLLVLAGLAVGLWFHRAPAEATSDATDVVIYVPVQTTRVEMQDSYIVTRRYTGEIVPLRTSDLGFEREGYLKEVHVREGSVVETNAILATLDTRRLEEQLKELAAAEREARAVLDELVAGPREQELRAALENVNGLTERLGFARSIRERKESLLARNAGTMDALEASRSIERKLAADLAMAREQLDKLNEGSRREQLQAQTARVDQLIARRNLLQIELSDSVLRAPYAGRISKRYYHEGTVIQKSDPVLQLLEHGRLTARIGVPLDAAASLPAGAETSVDVGGTDYSATVAARLPALSETTRTATIILDLCDDAACDLMVGQVVHLDLQQTIDEPGCWVPTSALSRGTRGLWSCLAVSETKPMPGSSDAAALIGRLQKQDVEILHAGEASVYVRGTLRADDRIVRDGTHRVVQGQWIEILDEPVDLTN